MTRALCMVFALLALAPGAWAQEIKVVIPQDPLVTDAELAGVERMLAALGKDLGDAVDTIFAGPVGRLRDRIQSINRSARSHRKRALALQAEIDAFKKDLAGFDEERARFDSVCASPANKAQEASCHQWAQRLEAARGKLRDRKQVLSTRAQMLDHELDAGLFRYVGRLRAEAIPRLQRELEKLQQQAQARRAGAGKRIGTARAVSGEAFLLTAKGLERLTDGAAIHDGGMIFTGAGGGLELKLSDGTIYQFGPSTHASFDNLLDDPASGDPTLVTRIKRGLVRIRELLKRQRRRRFHGPGVAVAVRGTDFILDVAGDGVTFVTVIEGGVTCTPVAGGAPVDVDAPGRIEISADGTLGPVMPIDVAAAELAWRASVGSAPDEKAAEETEDAPAQPVPPFMIFAVVLFAVVLALALLLRRKKA